mmetsp:Transcript_9437/g.20919  ORF Transcript_9437/g.20919 Transcript_9437/m.20919 type:complete len:92 (-) Transcript_9437:211-486(-)
MGNLPGCGGGACAPCNKGNLQDDGSSGGPIGATLVTGDNGSKVTGGNHLAEGVEEGMGPEDPAACRPSAWRSRVSGALALSAGASDNAWSN